MIIKCHHFRSEAPASECLQGGSASSLQARQSLYCMHSRGDPRNEDKVVLFHPLLCLSGYAGL